MRKYRKWLAVVTAAGAIVATASAGAEGIGEKISGWLRPDITVVVNGADTDLTPVIIDGRAYLPARGFAEAAGYEVVWSNDRLEFSKPDEDEEEAYMTVEGYIASVERDGDRWRIETIGAGQWLILYADGETVITGADGEPLGAEDLAPGMAIEAEYGPMMIMTWPGQSHAASIRVVRQHLTAKLVVRSVERTEDGFRIELADEADGDVKLVLHAGPDTLIIRSDKQPVDAERLASGMVVRAYYGPEVTKSLPPQSRAHLIEIDDQRTWPAPAEEREYRELAWDLLSDEDKAHLVTP